MKEAMLYFARCNKIINQSMTEILKNNLPDPYDLPLAGYYFKNLADLLDHTFTSDMIWMKAFLDVAAYGLDLTASVRSVPVYGDKVFASYTDYLEHRIKLDDFILHYMSLVEGDLFQKVVTRVSKSGLKMEKPVYRAMLHFFNHQTHHRGQISNILDNLGIENNYSNMITID